MISTGVARSPRLSAAPIAIDSPVMVRLSILSPSSSPTRVSVVGGADDGQARRGRRDGLEGQYLDAGRQTIFTSAVSMRSRQHPSTASVNSSADGPDAITRGR